MLRIKVPRCHICKQLAGKSAVWWSRRKYFSFCTPSSNSQTEGTTYRLLINTGWKQHKTSSFSNLSNHFHPLTFSCQLYSALPSTVTSHWLHESQPTIESQSNKWNEPLSAMMSMCLIDASIYFWQCLYFFFPCRNNENGNCPLKVLHSEDSLSVTFLSWMILFVHGRMELAP